MNMQEFTNPGILKLPIEDIYRGGNSKSRNPHMQTMLRLVGFGDNAGSGFPTILEVWKSEGWIEPELIEDTNLNQITLVMKMIHEGKKQEIINFEKKMSEVFSKKDFDKLLPIIKILEQNGEITPKEAENACGKSPATVRRYLSMLVNRGIVIAEGNTNTVVYKVVI